MDTSRTSRWGLTLLCLLAGAMVPAVSAQSVTVNLSGPQKPISPYIYGANEWCNDAGVDHTATRWGGNRQTGYNWETNASNAGSDYIHSSDNHLVMNLPQNQQSVPGMAVRNLHQRFRPRDQYILSTVQLAGYVSADMNGTVSEGEAAPGSRWREVVFEKPGGNLSTQPDLNDNQVYMDEFVNAMVEELGSAEADGVNGWSLDNEPALWAWTHPRIHPNHVTAVELLEKSADAAAAVKNVDPTADVFGPSSWGWGGMAYLDDGADWTSGLPRDYDWFLSAYLDGMKQASDAYGSRLLDVLDVHWYPEARGDCRIMLTDECDQTSPNQTAARLQAPRSLWDDGYVEDSWIADAVGGEPINLINRLKASIDEYYPGTKIAITEYEYGAHDHFSGGLAQADLLGIFGREGIYLATLWSDPGSFTSTAFDLFVDVDGNGLGFGDRGIPATVDNVENLSAYAALDSEQSGQLHLIVINKTGSQQSVDFDLEGSGTFQSAQVYGFGQSIGSNISRQQAVNNISDNSFSYNIPPYAALHFVLQGSGVNPVTEKPESAPLWSVAGRHLVFSPEWVRANSGHATRVKILSPNGATVFSRRVRDASVQVEGLPPGRYLLFLEGKSGVKDAGWFSLGGSNLARPEEGGFSN